LVQIRYLCTIMRKIETIPFVFDGKEYLVASIPDFFSNSGERLLIGPHSMNTVLYNDVDGYVSNEAEAIDEQIYAYIDDEYFSLSFDEFREAVLLYLD